MILHSRSLKNNNNKWQLSSRGSRYRPCLFCESFIFNLLTKLTSCLSNLLDGFNNSSLRFWKLVFQIEKLVRKTMVHPLPCILPFCTSLFPWSQESFQSLDYYNPVDFLSLSRLTLVSFSTNLHSKVFIVSMFRPIPIWSPLPEVLLQKYLNSPTP